MVKLDPRKNVNDVNKIPIWELGQEGGRTRPINRNNLYHDLIEAKAVLDKHKIKYCLSHGTMLGIYRDGDFIEWDDDVDIALLDFSQREYFATVCRAEFEALGFFMPPIGDKTKPIKATQPNANMPYYDSVLIKRGEKLEFWWFEKKGDFYIYDESRCGVDLKHPAKYYDELQDFEWRGHTWKIPNHIEDWLLLMYGTGWSKVDKNRKYNNQKFDSKGNPIPQNYDSRKES